MPNNKAEAFAAVKNDKRGLNVRGSFAHVNRKLMFLPPTQQAEVRGQIESFRESAAERNKLKMSVGNELRRCKEKRVYELQILGHPERDFRPGG